LPSSSKPDSQARAHDALIVALYDALGRGDGEAMAACYHPEARFSDPAFGELRGVEIGRMWRMLTSRATELEVELVDHQASDSSGSAHWIARYPFAATGRPVINDIRAEFRFRDGLIAEHDDRFDLRRWAAQALGPAGRLLGLTPFLPLVIQRRTRAQLAAFEPS
jgi:ketosteroid isomerase-like protein